MMTVGSLFAGIGGFDLGLERAGFTIRWQVENDPYCNRVLAKHWPSVKRYGDIKSVDWNTVEPVDVICGGFPCQDISIAGKGAGIEGERSGLWKEFYRAVRTLRPQYVIVENVSALRSRGLSVVLADLAEIGFDAEWDCIPACEFGCPQTRDRLWLVAYPEGQRQGQLRWARCAESSQATRDIYWPSREPGIVRVVDGVPKRVDRLKGLGNAVVPQVVEWLGRQILTLNRRAK